MSYLIEIFSAPFMQRAVVAGVILGLTLASLGVIATLRNMSFFGEGIAHASLAGIAIAILAGFAPLPVALLWGILVAICIYIFESSTIIASDSLIGIFFTASMALGIILMHLVPGYQPELMSFLFGSILAIKTVDVYLIVSLGILITAWFLYNKNDLVYAALHEEGAQIAGAPVKIQTITFYIMLAITIVLGVKMLGIILVSALLILPSASAKLISTSFTSHVYTTMIFGVISVLLGLLVSVLLNIPSGATIVLAGTVLFGLSAVTHAVTKS